MNIVIGQEFKQDMEHDLGQDFRHLQEVLGEHAPRPGDRLIPAAIARIKILENEVRILRTSEWNLIHGLVNNWEHRKS